MLKQDERETQKSDIARERHEFRTFRLEREKAEKAERHRKKKAALKAGDSKTSDKPKTEVDPKKIAILAAMERAKAKKKSIVAKNTENLTDSQKKLVDEADERRRQQRKSQAETQNKKDDSET